MKTPAVVLDVALALLKQHLAGFRGYPTSDAGELRFAEAFRANCISVEHMEATMQAFDQFFPTVRQIHDGAHNIRAKFEPEVADREKWKEGYGSPSPFPLYPADTMAMHWQAFRDCLYYTEGPGVGEIQQIIGRKDREASLAFWQAAIHRNVKAGHQQSIDFVRKQVAEVGWAMLMDLTSSPTPMPYTNPRDVASLEYRKGRKLKAAVVGGISHGTAYSPVTQADLDRANAERLRQVDTVSQSDEDGWDDPDR